MSDYRLYLVTDDQQDLTNLCQVVKQAVRGGVTMVQIREKHGDVRAFIQRAEAIKQLLSGTGVPLIINDRVDVALAVDADGVHLGQSDMPATIARQLLGADKLLGLSVENEQQFQAAHQLPVDYLGLSAIFATPTKTDTVKHWGLEGLTWAMQHTRLPLVAIGGLNQGNLARVAATGVDGVALVSAISHASQPEQAARALRDLIDAHSPHKVIANN